MNFYLGEKESVNWNLLDECSKPELTSVLVIYFKHFLLYKVKKDTSSPIIYSFAWDLFKARILEMPATKLEFLLHQ